jgi:hypothetical protein
MRFLGIICLLLLAFLLYARASGRPSPPDGFDSRIMEVDDLDNIEDADLEEIIFRFLEEDPSILELDEHQCFIRERPPKTDYWATAWGRMLLDPLTRLGYTKQAKNFRRRFRIPLQLFNHIHPFISDSSRFKEIPLVVVLEISLFIILLCFISYYSIYIMFSWVY